VVDAHAEPPLGEPARARRAVASWSAPSARAAASPSAQALGPGGRRRSRRSPRRGRPRCATRVRASAGAVATMSTSSRRRRLRSKSAKSCTPAGSPARKRSSSARPRRARGLLQAREDLGAGAAEDADGRGRPQGRVGGPARRDPRPRPSRGRRGARARRSPPSARGPPRAVGQVAAQGLGLHAHERGERAPAVGVAGSAWVCWSAIIWRRCSTSRWAAVVGRQGRRHVGADPSPRGARAAERLDRAARREGVAAPGDELAVWGEELDLADAAAPELEVVAVERKGPPSPLWSRMRSRMSWASSIAAKSRCCARRRARAFRGTAPRREVAACRPRLDVGRPLPGAAQALVVLLGPRPWRAPRASRPRRGAGAGPRGRRSPRPSCRSGAPSWRGPRARSPPGAGGEVRALHAAPRRRGHEVDVRRVVELVRAHLPMASATRPPASSDASMGRRPARDRIGHEYGKGAVHGEVGEPREGAGGRPPGARRRRGP
jgi:hypothetical protein